MNRSDGDEIPVFTGLPAPEYMQSVLVLSARLKNKKYCVEELDERHVESIDRQERILEFCRIPGTRKEIMDSLNLFNRGRFNERSMIYETSTG